MLVDKYDWVERTVYSMLDGAYSLVTNVTVVRGYRYELTEPLIVREATEFIDCKFVEAPEFKGEALVVVSFGTSVRRFSCTTSISTPEVYAIKHEAVVC